MLKRIDWRNIGRNWLGQNPQGRRRKATRDHQAANTTRMSPEALESRALLTLTVNLVDTSVAENAGPTATTATVTRDGDLTLPLTVALTSNDTGEATVQASVVIAAGQSVSPAFNIDAVDDLFVDGSQSVVITASEASHGNGIAILTVTDDDVATLTVGIAASSISEVDSAAATTGTVTRNTSTAGSLVVTLASNDTSEAAVPATVTIPAGQDSVTFNIDAVDDALLDGTQTATITASVAGFVDGTDTVDVTDVETLAIAISAASVAENAGAMATTATVTRSNTDNASPLIVTLNSDATDEATVPATVTIPGGQASVTFDIAAVDDALLDGTQTATITGTATGYMGGSDTVNVTDVETLTVAITAATVAENAGATATTATVTRNNTDTSSALVVTLASSDTTEATAPATVTILAGETSATFNIDAVDDALLDGTQTATITASATGYVNGTDTIDVTDVETLSVAITAAAVAENAGTTATTATVTRSNTDTTGALVVTLASSDTTEATAPATVTILAGETSATFNIDAVDDALLDGTQTATITASAAGYVNGTDTVDVTDVETLAVAITAAAVAENAGATATTATVTRSNTDTTGALVVTLASDDTTEATAPATVTILAGETSATFNIDAVDDALLDGTQTATITASATGYVNGTDTVDVTDDEALTVLIAAADISENSGTAATTATVTRNNTDTTSALVVTLASSDTTEATAPATVTILAGETSATFNIDAVDDALLDGTQTATITASATGYDNGTDTVDVTDVETLAVAITAAAVAENAGTTATTATVTRSNTDTTGALVVTLASSDTTEATAPATVTILAGETSATFNIDAVDDALLDGTQTATITASATGYVNGTDTVDVTDDEALTVLIAAADISENSGTTATTATVTRSNADTTSALVVTLASDDTSEATVPATVTILAGETSATFNIDAVDDALLDGTQTATITASATGYVNGTDTVDVTDVETLTVAITAAAVAENAGTTATTATVTRSNTDTTGALVVTLASSDTTEATAPATVTILAGETFATFNIDAVDDALLDGTQTATITASATGYISGSDNIDVTDVETLTVVITAAAVAENAGTTATTATVTRSNTDTTGALVVTLASDDTTEATAPATVTILAGETSATFNIDAVDDALLDGTQTATITASATGYVNGTDTVDVTDVETLAVVITAAAVAENAGATATTATVTRSNTDSTSALVVTLASDDTTEVTVPATVTILAGETSATFDISAVDDALLDGTQTVTVTASATSYSAVTDTVNVDDYETLTIAVTADSISENGGSTTATVTRSNTDTTSALSVSLNSDDTSEATVPMTVTIPAGQSSVTFDIDAVDDTLLDGTQVVNITATATGYVAVADSVDVTDYETLTLLILGGSIGESGGATTATVSRSGADVADSVVITLSSNDIGEATVRTDITIIAGQTTSAPFAIGAVDDMIADGDQTVTITAAGSGFVAATDTIIVTDDEGPTAVTVSVSPSSISELGGTAIATVSRNSVTTNSLTVTLTNNDSSEIDIPASVVIPAGQTSVTFTVTAVDDAIVDGTQTATITASATGHNNGSDDIDVTDTEVAALTLVIADAAIDEDSGVTTAVVTRNSDTTGPLVVTLQTSDASEAAPRQTTITIPAGVSESAPFFIDAVDDLLSDGLKTATITASATSHTDGSDSVDVTDNDGAAALSVSIVEAAISENGEFATATVSRNTEPLTDLVVTLTTSDTGEATVPTTVTILAGQSSASFQIDAVDDSFADGTQTVTITGAVTGFSSGTDVIDISDDEGVAGVSVSITDSAISENGGTTTGTVTRNSDTTAELTVTLTTDDTSEATVPASVVIPAGQTSAIFAITAVDDAVADGDQTILVTAAATGLANGTGSLQVTDDETATLTLAITDASISEDGGVTMATVTRNSDTTNALTVIVTSDDVGEATVPTTVVIPAGTTDSAPFAITAVNDLIADGDQTVAITVATAGHVDGTGSVLVTDTNGAAALTVNIVADEFSEAAGTAATTATVSRNTDTTDELIVTLTSGDSSEATVATTITIAAGQTTSAAFDIDAVDDAIVDGTQTVSITASAANLADGVDSVDVTDDDVAVTFNVLSPQGIITDLRPQISWNAVAGADSYDVYLNLDGEAATVFRQLNVDSGTTTITPDVDLEFARYRVFVYANFTGAPTLTATPHTFIVTATPEQLTPTGSVDNTPEFSWNRLAGATSYTLYVNVPNNPLTLTIDDPTPGETSPLTYTPTTALPSGDYKWWIRGIRESGWQGNWSSPTTFSTGGRSKVTSIAAGETVTTSTPQFTWSTVPDATSYEIYVSQEGTPGALFRDSGITTNTYPSRVLENGNYTVWIRTTKSDNTAVWGAGVPFTVNAATNGLQTTPTSPTGPGLDTTPEFVWEATAGATSYDIYLHNGVTSQLETGLTGTTFTPTTELAIGEWTWSIRPVDGSGVGAWSTPVTFDTEGRSTVLTPTSPAANTPTFTWVPVADAVRYILQVDNLTTQTSRVIREDNLTATAFTAASALTAGDYRVWVRAISNSSDGVWSLPLDFTVAASVTPQSQLTSPTTLLASVRSQLSGVEASDTTTASVSEQQEVAELTEETSAPVNADELMIAMLSSGQWLEG